MPLPKKHKISLECKEILTPKNKQMFSRPNQWTPIFFSFSREGEGKRMVFVFFFFQDGSLLKVGRIWSDWWWEKGEIGWGFIGFREGEGEGEDGRDDIICGN